MLAYNAFAHKFAKTACYICLEKISAVAYSTDSCSRGIIMEGFEMRGPHFTCFKDFTAYALPCLYPAAYALLLQLVLFSVSAVYAEETKVFTDADLENYNVAPMVDQGTLSRMEEDLNLYEKKRAAELLLGREKMKRRQAEEAKRLASKKQNVTVSHVPVSVQNSNNNSGIGYAVPRTSVSNQKGANNSAAGSISSRTSTRRT
jgi:hypothetical protein